MTRSLLASTIAALMITNAPAFAQDGAVPGPTAFSVTSDSALAPAMPAPPTLAPPTSSEASPAPAAKPVFLRDPSRPGALPALYVSFAVVQALDVYTTVAAIGAGGREANPVVASVGGHPAGLIAFKAATTAGTVYAVERMWRKNRVGAVVLMVALNGVTAGVVAHNRRVTQVSRAH